MSYPMLELQQAIYALLNGDAALQNLINGIYDQPPDDATFPFVALEDLRAEDWAFAGAGGSRVRLEIAAYSRYHGKGEVYGILERLHDVLHATPLNLVQAEAVQMRVLESRTEALSDGRTQRGSLLVEIWLHSV